MQRTKPPATPTLIPLIAVVAVTAVWSFTARAGAKPQSQDPAATECQVELQPEVVAGGSDVMLGVRFEEDMGEIIAVRTEKGSGIVVEGFDPEAAGLSDLTARLEIPTGAAGAWWLEFDAAGATCRALLTVTESALGR